MGMILHTIDIYTTCLDKDIQQEIYAYCVAVPVVVSEPDQGGLPQIIKLWARQAYLDTE